MKYIRLLLTLFLVNSSSVLAEKLSIERIFSSPSLSGPSMRGLQISPDGSRVTFLKGKESDYERLDLWELDVKTGHTQMLFNSDDLHSGEEYLSDEEKARRERLRLTGTGIVSYQWSDDGKALFFPLAGDIYYYQLSSEFNKKQNVKKLFTTPEFETDIRFSPKATYLSYIRAQNLYIYNLKTNQETQLTQDGGEHIKYGMAEFVAQEEMGRMTGYWWSQDESKIAFTKVDESSVEEVTRSEIYADEIKMIKQRYPFAGENNARVELAMMDLNSKEVRWVDLGKNTDIYLPRVQWTRDNNLLSFQWQSRDQKELKLNLVDWTSMKINTLIKETSKSWINLYDDLYFLKDGKRFIWASEKDGFKHLYLYDLNGRLIRQLTQGDWVVDALENVDDKNAIAYFSGRKETPLESHLYSVSFDGKNLKKITNQSGMNSIVFSKDSQTYINHFSSLTTPPQVSLHQSSGERIVWLSENKVDEQHPLFNYQSDWITPELGSFISEDKTKLYYRLFKPADFNAQKKYPVLVYLYGGPHSQQVSNKWGSDFLQYFAQQGYVVFTVDNRGSINRGKKFEEPLYHAMGEIEVKDQIEGVKFLRSFPWVDSEKIGVHGHSYGGYMTLMTMFKAPQYFKAGVAGAPVTDWALYDTHYTERYMGNPKEVKDAYEKSSVFPYATNLAGPLLIYHGMADDNVLFKNSTRLYKTLQDNNIQFYMMDYPGKKHSISGKTTSMHRANMILNFFDLHFGIKREIL